MCAELTSNTENACLMRPNKKNVCFGLPNPTHKMTVTPHGGGGFQFFSLIISRKE